MEESCTGYLSIIACIPLFKYAWDLNVLTMGEETAKSLGTNPGKTRLACITFSALAVAAIISFVGPIGFICLVPPHIARFLVGTDHRFLMIGSALIGSLLLTSADLTARVIIAPFELPVGVLTAFIGAPLFVHLLLKARREVWL
ncbi:MAG: FecCD family ABC transporter permease [Nitrososphaerales archaeon]